MAIPTINVTIGALLTIFIYSYILYKENPIYRLAEGALIGLTLGNMIVMTIKSLLSTGIYPFAAGNFLLIIPLAFGVLMFSQYFPKYARLARWPIAMLSSIGLAVAIRGSGHTYIYNEIKASFIPLTSINNIIIILCLSSTLFYFLYTFNIGKNPILNRFHTLGRYAIMTYLGAMFGSVTMTRLAWMTPRVQALVEFFKVLIGF
jgi:hypothetical protein